MQVKTPLELAFGRRPRDVVSIENSTPSHLTADLSPSELTDRQIQQLAMKSYLEVRQSDDVRRVLAQRLLPSQGLFQAGDRVYYWQFDPNKIKHGIKQGKWILGKVIHQDGPLCQIDIGNTVVRVNLSNLIRDHDDWHDIPVLLVEREDAESLAQAHGIANNDE